MPPTSDWLTGISVSVRVHRFQVEVGRRIAAIGLNGPLDNLDSFVALPRHQQFTILFTDSGRQLAVDR